MTVNDVQIGPGKQTLVRTEVCVRTLPPDAQGDRTRISWDPWSIRAGGRNVDAALDGNRPKGMFRADGTYGVGDCASGWIPFPTAADLDNITYANGVGDRATWDANRLSKAPTTSKDPEPKNSDGQDSIGEGTYIVNDDIRPGRYKARADSGGSCYWARLKDDTGDSDSIIANNISEGAASVTTKTSDGAFETRGCTPWIRQ